MRSRTCCVLLLVGLGALAVGCRGRTGHPVLSTVRSAPLAGAAAAPSAPTLRRPDGALARSLLFLGWQDAEAPLRYLARRPTPVGSEPRLVHLPRVERAVLERYARGGPVGGVVREVMAAGFSVFLPLAPEEAADLLLDPEFEKNALDADRFETVAVEFDVAGARRQRALVEMLRRGHAPILVDLKFASLTERWDLPDGSVIMRHDPYPLPPPEHVTLYRGATWIVPEGRGSRVTEFLVMGTDIRVPFFLRGLLRKESVGVFRIRAIRLWRTARALREGR